MAERSELMQKWALDVLSTMPGPAASAILMQPLGPAGPKRYLAAGQFLLGCVIMPAALTFVFLK